MQNYGQQQPVYQRPGSVASFGAAPAPAPPPPYGGQPGYQSAAPQAQSQWAPPAQNPAPTQQWSQPQQAPGGYNPGVYGATPGAYTQGQTAPNQPPSAYPTQQQDNPPPPPPKPAGFVATAQQQPQPQPQQNTQSWGQQPAYGVQQTPQGYQAPSQGQQGGYAQQTGFPAQDNHQPSYNTTAPAPQSQVPAGSYFPPVQPTQQGRPGSIYGADQLGAFSSPASATGQQPPNSVFSPNEQQPAYIPPSLTGQGVQSYMPANTNPMPGVYVPPPPDIPAWQQAQHAPLQGGKKFRYTKPSVDPSFYAQGYQGVQPVQQQQQQQQGQFGQQPVQVPQNQQQFTQPAQAQFQPQVQQQQQQQQGQFGQPQNPYPQAQLQGQFGQPAPQQTQLPQQLPLQYQTPTGQPNQTLQQPQPNQWQPTPAEQGFNQQQQQQQNVPDTHPIQPPTQQHTWQPGHPTQGSMAGQQYTVGQEQAIQAPKPMGHTGSTPPGFVNQPSPQSTPVSPVQHRQSVNYGSSSSQVGLGRTGSVSSIALGAIHAQRAGNRTESPKPPPANMPTPPPPRDDKSKFSVLAMGGPSDWEHFGEGVEEIDDEEFFTKKDEKNEAAQLDSVELPAPVPSPPSAQGEWPSPASQPAHTLRRHDTFQPTPPMSGTPVPRPSSQAQQQSFVMGDAPPPAQTKQGFVVGDAPPQQAQQAFIMGDAPLREAQQTFVMGDAPPQTQNSQPQLSTQQGFAMGDTWTQLINQDTHAQQPPLSQPTAGQQGFIVSDDKTSQAPADKSLQGTNAFSQHLQTTNTSFVMDDNNWESSQQTPLQKPGGCISQPNTEHLAELKAKDEAYERLKSDAENEKAEIHLELNKLNVVFETLKTQAESDRKLMHDQIEQLKQAAIQEKGSTDALNKEKTIEIERLKEDAEGKDDTIKERDATIAELRRQLQESSESVANLRRELEENKTVNSDLQQQLAEQQSRAALSPTAAGLLPDVGPWYISSLERYIVMLKNEALEPLVEEKIKTFTSFLEAESNIRGIPFYKAPPAAAAIQGQGPVQQHMERTIDRSNAPMTKQDLNVQVPTGTRETDEDEFDYSPGGRPRLRRKATIKSDESVPMQQSFTMTSDPSGQATVYTPTSSQDEDFNKTPTPMQSPPEEQPQSQYKAYVPPGVTQAESVNALHRQSVSFTPTPLAASLQSSGSNKNHDEIFFNNTGTTTANKGAPSARTPSDASTPAPLFTQLSAPSAVTQAPVSKRDPLDILKDLIPAQVVISSSSEIEKIRKKLSTFTYDFSFIQETTGTWERAAALARKKNDDARRKRQEESEARTDELYNDNQIAYVDIGPIEDEFKEKERVLKAQEDRDEYKTYVEIVFDKVYDDLQSQIKDLMDLYIEAETLVQTSVSGVKSMEQVDIVSTAESLKLLKGLHDLIEARHEKVVLAVAERDKRYKRTEIQPLYAAGNIAKMKSIEKHFENAEKQAVFRAKSEKAERVDGLVRLAEEAVVSAVGIEQGEIDAILEAIRELPDHSDEGLLTRARETLLALKGSSKALLELFNGYEIELNTAVTDAEISQARAENAAAERITMLEQEKILGEKKIRDEYMRRVQVIDQDKDEIDALIEQKGGKATLSEEDEKKLRMQRALEEAKRRNGDL